MENQLNALSDDDVQQIISILERLENSSFDFLRLELGDLKLTIGKGDWPLADDAAPGAPTRAEEPAASPVAVAHPSTFGGLGASGVPVEARPARPEPAGQAEPSVQEGTVPITAPIAGILSTRSPSPGAPPFVELGGEVEETTTVGLIEVMKVFNAVSAGVRGVIAEICVRDAEFVEYGQTLFRVRPA